MTRFCPILIVTILLAGCGPTPPKLVPVTGTVIIDGQPAANIHVMFVPKTVDETVNAPSSNGLTNSEGVFTLKTADNLEGAIPGEHLVTLLDTEEERPAQGETATKPPRLAPRFATDGVTVEVVEGQPIEIKATGPGG